MTRKQTISLTGVVFALTLTTSFASEAAQETGNSPAMQGHHRHHAMHHGSPGSGGRHHRSGSMACEGGGHGARAASRPGGASGMMHGAGMSGMGGARAMHEPAMRGFNALWSLDLTEEQREQLATIHDELHKQHWSLRGSLFDDETKLRRLYAAQPRDAKAIGAIYGRIFDVRRQMIEATIEASNRAEAVLTEAQREQFKPLRGSWR